MKLQVKCGYFDVIGHYKKYENRDMRLIYSLVILIILTSCCIDKNKKTEYIEKPITSAPFICFTPIGNGNIRITKVLNLEKNSKYTIIVEIF